MSKAFNDMPRPPVKRRATGRFREKHGGDVPFGDEWLCDTCARRNINLCKCGNPARLFGEALFFSISCESCDEYIAGVDVLDICDKWNQGIRGFIN